MNLNVCYYFQLMKIIIEQSLLKKNDFKDKRMTIY